MYFSDSNVGKIWRSNLDGTNIEDLVTGLTSPWELVLDLQMDNKIYWTDWTGGTISRADLDGSNVETVITGLSGPRGIAVIPEPATLGLLLLGGVALLRRRR